MNIVQREYLGEVEAYKLGFGPIGPPLMSVYMYWVDGILIDTGQHHMQRAVVAQLAEKKLNSVLLTHHHEDHSGNAAAIRRAHGARVIGHPETARLMKSGFNIRPYQHFIWGKAPRTEVIPYNALCKTERYKFTPIHTPGHCRDHTVYLEKNKGWLFSGDLYLGDKIKFFRADEQMAEQIDSLKKTLEFEFEFLFCAHRPCLKNGKIHLERKLSFLEDFSGNVQKLSEKGCTEDEIIHKMSTAQDRLVKWITLGNASFANMVRSALRTMPHSKQIVM